MKKLLLFLCAAPCIVTPLLSTYYLQQSASDDPETIFVKEVTQQPIHGFSSSGECSTMYQEVTVEKHLTLLQAYDIGVRHHQLAILSEALTKLKKKGQRIDMLGALDVIHDSLISDRSSKRIGYIFGGIVSAGAILPWLGPDIRWQPTAIPIHRRSMFGSYPTGRYIPAMHVEVITSTERLVVSALFAAIGGGIALYNYWCFKRACKESVQILALIAASDIVYVSDKQQAHRTLMNIRQLLCDCDKPCIDSLNNQLNLLCA